MTAGRSSMSILRRTVFAHIKSTHTIHSSIHCPTSWMISRLKWSHLRITWTMTKMHRRSNLRLCTQWPSIDQGSHYRHRKSLLIESRNGLIKPAIISREQKVLTKWFRYFRAITKQWLSFVYFYSSWYTAEDLPDDGSNQWFRLLCWNQNTCEILPHNSSRKWQRNYFFR